MHKNALTMLCFIVNCKSFVIGAFRLYRISFIKCLSEGGRLFKEIRYVFFNKQCTRTNCLIDLFVYLHPKIALIKSNHRSPEQKYSSGGINLAPDPIIGFLSEMTMLKKLH